MKDADRYRGARRRFLAWLGLGVVGSAGLGFFAGRHAGPIEEDDADAATSLDRSLLARMRRAATGPMDLLERQFGTFLGTLDSNRRDELLWLGFERLAYRALVTSNEALRRRLLVTARAPDRPARIEEAVSLLERGR